MCRDSQGALSTAVALATDENEAREAHRESRKRQRALLGKFASSSKAPGSRSKGEWRPPKRYRVSSYKTIVQLDGQLRTLGMTGLARYACDGSQDRKFDADPVLTIVWDQESSNIAAAHYMMYHRKMQIDFIFDGAHGAWNDVRAACKDANYMGFLLGLLLVWNLPHGPWSDDMRWSQTRELLAEFTFAGSEPPPPLIAARVHDALEECGRLDTLASGDAIEELWSEFCEHDPFRRKGAKVSLNRWMSLVQTGRHELRVWSMRRACYELVAMESDWLKDKISTMMVARSASDAAAGAGGVAAREVTTSRRPDVVDRAVRSSCENSLVVGVYLLSAPLARRRLAIFLEVSDPVERWFNTQSRTCRSVRENRTWTLQQVSGQCMQHIALIWVPMTLRASLKRAGFWLPHSDVTVPPESVAALDDALAGEIGSLVLSMLRHRLIRTLPLTLGWPANAILMMESPESEASVAEARRLMGAHEQYRAMVASQGEDDKIADLCKRSMFARPIVQRIVRGLQENGGAPSPRLQEFLRGIFSRAVSTTMVEDGFNHMKNDKVFTKRRRLGAPERSMAAVACSGVLSSRHRYSELDRGVGLCQRGGQLPREVFRPDPKEASVDCRDIVGKRANTSWWSPNAERSQCPIADLALMSHGDSVGDYTVLAHSWLGVFMKPDHLIVVRKREPAGGCWHFALGPVGDSGVLLWPAHERQMGQSAGTVRFFEPDVRVTRPILAAVCSLEAWEAATFEFRSPAWAAAHHPTVGLPPRLLAVATCQPAPLLKVASDQAFWSLDMAVLQGVSKYLGNHETLAAADLFTAVLGLIKHAQPTLTDDEALTICARRTIALSKRASCEGVEDVMELQDAGEFLDADDFKSLKKLRDTREARKVECDEFKAEVVKRRRAAGSSGSCVGRSGGSAGAARRRLPAVGVIPHAEVKALAPPGAFVWRSHSDGAWVGRLPPFGEHSRSWSKWGERQASVQVLQVLWTEWSHLEGVGQEAIPVEGLFPSSAGDAHSSAAASGGVASSGAACSYGASGAEQPVAPAPKAASKAVAKQPANARRRGRANAGAA